MILPRSVMNHSFSHAYRSTVRANKARFGNTSIRQKTSSLSRYGLGGHHWKRFNPESYQELIRQALSREDPVSYFEVAGQEGGDIAMVGAIQSAIEKAPDLAKLPITITTRLGYRTLEQGDAAQKVIPGSGDVLMQEGGKEEQGEAARNNIVHNVSSSYIQNTVQSSPLLELQQDLPNLNLVFLIQNPEVQVLDLLKENPKASLRERQEFIRDRWTPGLETLQEYSVRAQEKNGSVSFGVVSNGLGIPEKQNHPMHLNVETVISAAEKYDQFSTIQLPANLLERHGWNMAKEIRQTLPKITITTMRPLTCYPDLGTGTGHPFRLVDYALPSLDGEHPHVPVRDDDLTMTMTKSKKIQYTHGISGVPAIYQIALQTAMSHFDAEALLEIKQERDLTMEERETLDGCKLVQSMLHDLDADLEKVRSFAAHEEELYGRIIPLLYDTFEAMDDHTSDVLQAYFAAYAVAVRYSIAKKTRQVLREGESGSGSSADSPTYPDIPPNMSLQEYALRKMMADKTFDRLVVGASTMQDFKHQTELVELISKEEDPLNAITKANEVVEAAKKRQKEEKQKKEQEQKEQQEQKKVELEQAKEDDTSTSKDKQ